MGRMSKLHASPVVSLCKERKEIIKAAKYCRYDLVTSFVVYLESLLELGNALNNYVDQELVIVEDCCAHLEFPLSDTDSDLDLLLHQFQCDEKELPSSHCHSPVVKVIDESNCTCNCTQHHAEAESYMMDRGKPRVENNTSTQEPFQFSFNNPHHRNYEDTTHIHMSSEDFGHHDNSQMVGTPKGGHWFPHQHVNRVTFGASKSFPYYAGDRFVHNGAEPFPMAGSPSYGAESQKHGTDQNNASTVPPVPPQPQFHTWNFLYPFGMNHGDVPCYGLDRDVREVREREGIPDLEEDEGEQSLNGSDFYQMEMESEMRHDSGSEDGEEVKTTVQDSESLGTCSVTTPASSCRMSLKEAVVDIRNEFKYVFDCGREFSSVIELGKLPYHSVGTKLRGRISGLIVFTSLTYG